MQDLPINPKKSYYTKRDFDLLPPQSPYELIGGRLFMTPSPVPNHQRVSRNLGFIIHLWLKQHDKGEIFSAPIDVELDEANIVQPDLLIIKKERLDIIKEKRIIGAPDVVIEILSPENAYYDLRKKFKLYEWALIPEYWIVDIEMKSIEIYRIENGKYVKKKEVEGDGIIQSDVFDGLSVDLKEVFT